MLARDRQNLIVEYTEENGSADVSSLAKKLGVSEVTIRRDLTQLENNGEIQRVHGGAIPIITMHQEPEYIKRLKENNEVKISMAREAIKLIRDDMVIFLDAGTSIFEIAKLLLNSGLKNLKIITNDINTAYLIYQSSNYDLIIIGGDVTKKTGNISGTICNQNLKNLYSHISFVGASSISSQLIMTTPDEKKIELKNTIVNQSSASVLVADQVKFKRRSLYKVISLNDFTYIITDYKFTETQKKLLDTKTIVINV